MQVVLQNGETCNVCLFIWDAVEVGKKLHNLDIRRDLLLIYIFECKFKNEKIKRAGTDVLAEYDIHYSNEEILNCFPNYSIKHWASFFIFSF